METIKRSVVTRAWGWGGMNRWSTEDFQGSETTLQDTIKLDSCHYTFVKTCRMYNTKNEP